MTDPVLSAGFVEGEPPLPPIISEGGQRVADRIASCESVKRLDAFWLDLGVHLLAESSEEEIEALTELCFARRKALGGT